MMGQMYGGVLDVLVGLFVGGLINEDIMFCFDVNGSGVFDFFEF